MIRFVKVLPDKIFGRRICPSCAAQVNTNNNRCPICRYEFPHEPRGKKAARLVIGIILLFALLSWWL